MAVFFPHMCDVDFQCPVQLQVHFEGAIMVNNGGKRKFVFVGKIQLKKKQFLFLAF